MDTVTRERRSEIMSRIKSKDTKPEKIVRSLLHKKGFRFRLHGKGLLGKPDLVLQKFKTVIFVHGCFWHGCKKCDRGTRVPKTNREFWQAKVAENQLRDQRVAYALEAAGWRVVTIWQCETSNIEQLETVLSRMLLRIA